jgi:AcrR family transcriptional regulator
MDRRARKKAQTREQVRAVAQRLFAQHGFDTVTIADVAREADVAVQTVFNHFATKEELFFDGRTPWVDGPAEAVRSRAPGVHALRALREYLVDAVEELLGSLSTPERQSHIATVEASETLRMHERELVHEAERRLHTALLEAWTTGAGPDEAVPGDPQATAPVMAAIWLATSRSVIIGHRPQLTEGADPEVVAATAAELADQVFGRLEGSIGPAGGRVRTTARRVDTGWPRAAIRAAV